MNCFYFECRRVLSGHGDVLISHNAHAQGHRFIEFRRRERRRRGFPEALQRRDRRNPRTEASWQVRGPRMLPNLSSQRWHKAHTNDFWNEDELTERTDWNESIRWYFTDLSTEVSDWLFWHTFTCKICFYVVLQTVSALTLSQSCYLKSHKVMWPCWYLPPAWFGLFSVAKYAIIILFIR